MCAISVDDDMSCATLVRSVAHSIQNGVTT